ncbi:hypothetical protein BGX31_009385 [Mortierella sp. GBA43]|nr:hypothetical protein BGX31_009385 [Mortierella sp. GBA43]
MEYRRLVNESHLMVLDFLQSQGYNDTAAAFEREAGSVLEDVPKSTPKPKPLLEVLTDIRMAELQSQMRQLNMPSELEEQDLATPGDNIVPNKADQILQSIHSINVICSRTADVTVAPAWQDLDAHPGMESKVVPALVTSAADRTVKFTLLEGSHGDEQAGQVFKIFQPHSGVVLDLDFHPLHPELMLTSAMDKSTVLTNTITGEEHQKFQDHGKFVVRAKFAMDGAAFITGSHDKTVRIYKALKDEEGDEPMGQKRLPRYALDKTLNFKGAVEGLCVLPSSKNRPPTVVIGTRDDNYLHYVDLTTYNTVMYNMNVNKDDWVSFTPMDISASPHNDGATDSPLQLSNYYGVPTDGFSTPRHAWHPSGKYFYVTGNDHKVYCFQVGTQSIAGTLDGHTMTVRSLYMDSRRNMLISCGFDKTIRTWIYDATAATVAGNSHS